MSRIESRYVNQKTIFTWEIAGFVIISVLGSLLHFAFEFFGEWPPAALIAAVNESVWEHLKLAFWPALIYALVEAAFFRGRIGGFWSAKTIGILSMPVIIVAAFYGYTTLLGRNILWVDISLFVAAVFIGQVISGRLMLRRSFSPTIRILTMVLLVSLIAAFALSTFFPPHAPLFRDPRTGEYGILR